MKLPTGLLDINGKVAKGWVVLYNSNDEELMEFGANSDGTTSSCYVLTSIGDHITVKFGLNPGIAEHVDLQVDGIVRETMAAKSLDKEFKSSFKRVWHQVRETKKGSEIMGPLRYCVMEVQPRHNGRDREAKEGISVSDVGSLRLMLIRTKAGHVGKAGGISEDKMSEDSTETDSVGAMFDEYANWWELSPHIDPEGTPPPFEIGFVDKKAPSSKKIKERAMTKRTGPYEIIGSIQFHLRPTADLKALGFDNVPTYYVTEPSPPAEESDRAKALSLTVDDDSLGSLFVDDTEDLSGTPDASGVSNGGTNIPQSVAFPQQTTKEDLLHILSQNAMRAPNMVPRKEPEAHEEQREVYDTPAPIAKEEFDRIRLQDYPMAEVHDLDDVASNHVVESAEKPSATKTVADTAGGMRPALKPERRDSNPMANPEIRKNGGVINGLEGAPAHQSYMERAETEPSLSQGSTPNIEQHSLMSGFQSSLPGSLVADNAVDELRSPARMARSRDHISIEPTSSSSSPTKRSSLGFDGNIVSRGGKRLEVVIPVLSNSRDDLYSRSRATNESSNKENRTKAKLIDDSPAILASGSNGDTTSAKSFTRRSNSITVPRMDGDSQMSYSSFTGHKSPPAKTDAMEFSKLPFKTASEASTEVAPEEEIQAAIKKSHQLSPKLSQGLPTSESLAQIVSKPLGHPSTPEKSFGREIQENDEEAPCIAMSLARSHWPGRTPLNEPSAAPSHIKSATQPPVTPLAKGILFPNSPIPSSPSHESRLSDPRRRLFSSEKRKAGNISGALASDVFDTPRKSILSPAMRDSPDTELRVRAAHARLEAAKRQKEELQEALKAAKESKAAREINAKAEQLERENAELQAQIEAMYGMDEDL